MLNSDGHFFLKFFSYSRKASAPLPGNVLQKRVRSIVRRNKLFWSHTFVPTYRILASEIIFYWLFYVWKILWWLLSLESVRTPPENIWLDWLGVEKSNFFGCIPIFYFRIIPLKIVNHEVFYLYRKSPWLDFVKVMLSVPEGIWLIKV